MDVVSVDDAGNIKGVSEGTATITAEVYGGISESIQITVVKEILPEVFRLTSNSIELLRHKKTHIGYSILPELTTKKELSWESLNPEIATVSATGEITAIKKGRATIKVVTVNGLEEVLTVNVTDIPATSAYVENGISFVGMKVGTGRAIKLNLLPTNNTTLSSEFSYVSHDTSIATVSENGYVNAVGVGHTRILIFLDGDAIGFLEVLVVDS